MFFCHVVSQEEDTKPEMKRSQPAAPMLQDPPHSNSGDMSVDENQTADDAEQRGPKEMAQRRGLSSRREKKKVRLDHRATHSVYYEALHVGSEMNPQVRASRQLWHTILKWLSMSSITPPTQHQLSRTQHISFTSAQVSIPDSSLHVGLRASDGRLTPSMMTSQKKMRVLFGLRWKKLTRLSSSTFQPRRCFQEVSS